MAAVPLRLVLPLVLLAGLTAFPLRAAEKAPARPAAAAAAPKTAMLTPAQLQECENLKTRLRAQTDEALKEKTVLEGDKAELVRSGKSLVEELAALDPANEAAADAYKARAGQRDKQIDSYEARVAAYNGKAEAVNAIRDSHEKKCVNRRYDERDLDDLKRKK